LVPKAKVFGSRGLGLWFPRLRFLVPKFYLVRDQGHLRAYFGAHIKIEVDAIMSVARFVMVIEIPKKSKEQNVYISFCRLASCFCKGIARRQD